MKACLPATLTLGKRIVFGKESHARSRIGTVLANTMTKTTEWSRRLVGYALAAVSLWAGAYGASGDPLPPVVVYHRFGAVASDGMTVRTSAFAAQLEFLKENDFTVVPLRKIVNRVRGGNEPLPDKAVAITVDDGHRSVYTEMLPLVRRYSIPVTLFIYPSAISNASYALTWRQLEELRQSGLFDIQSHTYWHPNFKQERRRLPAGAYRGIVRMQLVKPRQILARRLGINADMLAWPFGIYDDELMAAAGEAGYVAGFTLDRRHPSPADRPLALPRYLITSGVSLREFRRLLGEAP
ncbi:MAG: polysaccharide deacetylase family protein [Sterolibacterium sp.]|jgi:peptidoglycan/xylan/chitin deacetylase (PgdA/CDA1 family)